MKNTHFTNIKTKIKGDSIPSSRCFWPYLFCEPKSLPDKGKYANQLRVVPSLQVICEQII